MRPSILYPFILINVTFLYATGCSLSEDDSKVDCRTIDDCLDGYECIDGTCKKDESGCTQAGCPGLLSWVKYATGAVSPRISAFRDGSFAVTGTLVADAVFGPSEEDETLLEHTGNELDQNVFAARFNADGSLAWAKNLGLGTASGVVGYSDSSMAVLQDKDEQSSIVTLGPLGTSGGDIVLGSGLTSYGIEVSSDGAFAVVGMYNAASVFGVGDDAFSKPVGGGNDVFLAYIEPTNRLKWVETMGGAGLDVGYDVSFTADGQIVVVGSFEGTATFGKGQVGEKTLDAAGDTDAFVALYDEEGSLAWVKSAGHSDNTEYTRALAVTAQGASGIYVAGNFFGKAIFGSDQNTVTLSSSSLDEADLFLCRYETDGTFSWADPRLGKV